MIETKIVNNKPSCKKFQILDIFDAKEYSDFLGYCSDSDLFFVDEVNLTTLIAFKAKYNCSHKRIEKIKYLLEKNKSELKFTPPPKKLFWFPDYNDRIESLALSNRTTKALNNKGITTVQKFLNLSIQDIYAIKNLGKKSVDEIQQCQKKLIGYGLQSNIINIAENDLIQLVPDFNNSIKSLNLSVRSTNALIENGFDTIEKLINIEEKNIYKLKNIGKKSAEEIILTRNKIMILRDNDSKLETVYDERQRCLTKLQKAYQHIPEARLGRLLQDYLSTISSLEVNTIVKEYKSVLSKVVTIKDISSVFKEICKDDSATQKFLLLLDILSIDLMSIFNQIFEETFKNKKYFRYFETLQKRVRGEILQDIAKNINMTRERARQLENKGIKILNTYLDDIHIDIFAFIDIENNFEKIITIEELNQCFGNTEYFDLLLFTMKTKPIWNAYKFIKCLNVFCHYSMLESIDTISKYISELPTIISKNRRDEILFTICNENNLPLKAVTLVFNNVYKQSGKICYRGKLSLTRIYEYVLKKCYPSGIKLFDDSVIEHFKKKILDIFGEIEISENNNAIYSRISSVSILYDRGSYIHPHYVSFDNDLLDEIEEYIKISQRDTFSYNELFETFKQKLFLKSNVNNRYFFQGVLNYKLGNKFYFSKETISKKQSRKYVDELEEFIKQKEKVHKKEILSEFKGISQIVFSMKVNKNKNIIYFGNGWYAHSEKLCIKHEDYEIKKNIDKFVRTDPVSARKLLELLWKTDTEFLTRNSIDTYEKLYSVLRFMFADKYTFSRPYIAPLGKEDISNKNVVKEYLKQYKSITISELIDICEEHHLRYFSIRKLIRQLNNEFYRINDSTLARYYNNLDDAIVDDIMTIIMEPIEKQGFLVASQINSFVFYPDIGFEWNSFLLRSIVEKYMQDIINIIDIPVTDTYIMSSVFVNSKQEINTYESLLQNVLRTEHDEEPFQNVIEVVSWVKEKGLIIGKTPKCLLDESILAIDEYGKLFVR